MWQANVGWNAQEILCEISPTLEVVTHGRVNRQFGVMKFRGSHIFVDLWITQQLENRSAARAAIMAAMQNGTGRTYCCAQVILRDCIGRLTLGLMWNGRNAKDRLGANLNHDTVYSE